MYILHNPPLAYYRVHHGKLGFLIEYDRHKNASKTNQNVGIMKQTVLFSNFCHMGQNKIEK